MDPIRIDEIQGILTYLRSIDWTDPWLIALITCHSCLLITTIVTRHHGNFQAVLFFVLLLLVYFSENLNEIGAKHWRSFSRQQYFDSRGLFTSLVFSIPLLMCCLIMVCNWLYVSGTLMVKLKRAQLREQARALKAGEKKTSQQRNSVKKKD